MRPTRISLLTSALVTVLAALAISGCGSSTPGASGGPLRVVAAENVWGSLAAQLGGDRVRVTSVIASPDADPHDYEPRAADARAMADARVAIVNGIGYDAWARRLLDANPAAGRIVVDVGEVTGLRAGDNPHQWYSPDVVAKTIDRISAAYQRLDPDHAAYYEQRRARLLSNGLARYRHLIDDIRARYGATAVGASEGVFAPLAQALGLRLATPVGFMAAVSEGTDPSAADKQAADRQIAAREIAVWVSNGQNATPDVQRLDAAAEQAGIPVVKVTETLVPASARFQDWQVAQLEQLARALARATGR